jgi:hypothetical protein
MPRRSSTADERLTYRELRRLLLRTFPPGIAPAKPALEQSVTFARGG